MQALHCGCATPHTHTSGACHHAPHSHTPNGSGACLHATHTLAAAAADDDDAWADEMAKMLAKQVKDTWNKKAMPKPSTGVTRAYGQKFEEAVDKGMKMEYDTPDPELKKHLTQKAYQFAAAKNYAQTVQLTRALIDDQGKVRSWSQFKQAAFAINDTHTTTWLRAEYDTAVGSAQMASKWLQIQANKATLPLLQFDAVIDGQTTDLCRSLEGIIKPVDDPFWDKYYPPNHFKCRSTVRQLARGVITPDDKIVHPEKLPKAFQTNLAKTGMLFPKDHPYFIGMPTDMLNSAAKIKPKPEFEIIDELRQHGNITQHSWVDQSHNDYGNVKSIALEFAKMGKPVKILPNIQFKDDPEYNKVFGKLNDTKYAGTCPDLLVGDLFYEHEGFTTDNHKRALGNMLSRGLAQSSYIIINHTTNSDRKILRSIYNRIAEGQAISEVWILKDDKIRLLFKNAKPQ